MPLSTATPKRAMKPTPADMLKGISLIHKAKTPPITASGIAVKTSSACFIELKVKKSKKRIKPKAIGTAKERRLLAVMKFSN